jgi:hypothetical protein
MVLGAAEYRLHYACATFLTRYLLLCLHLQLDVDLSTAPGPGAVQLELWQGLNILASAPLLLLPSLPRLSSPDDQADPLLQELHQHVGQHSWAGEAVGSTLGAATGASAFLCDLGHLLFTVDCINSRSTAPPGVPTWGGGSSAIISHHRTNTPLLVSSLSMAEGLLEYAHSATLPHTAHIASSARQCIAYTLHDFEQPSQYQSHPPSTQAGPSVMIESKQLTLSSIIHAAICGFKPPAQEEAYRVWSAKTCSPLLLVWKPIFHMLMIASAIGSMRRGDPFSITDIPIHLVLCSPHTLAFGLAVAGQHRWAQVYALSKQQHADQGTLVSRQSQCILAGCEPQALAAHPHSQ